MPDQSRILRPGLRDVTAVGVMKASRVVHGLMLRSKLRIKSRLGMSADSGNWEKLKGSYWPRPAYSRVSSCTSLRHLMPVLSDAFLQQRNCGSDPYGVSVTLCHTSRGGDK
ncbi:hypothetical protein llap_21950 [Limosa lapponica baueri]|uniref:Uncharacterized protein n=1 Tax=Limosa lapponica baueri TaxID=1758121 RepID=A0A2I0T1Q9_LIMLA|nr:hypothetical protein llap_21950 [Limosa lapponica baueri]